MPRQRDRLATALAAEPPPALLVVTGAGISRASGLPTFRGRDTGAIWRQSDVEKATVAYFHADPVGQWRWYLERFESLDRARPNAAHHALAALERRQVERGGEFRLVTQNIDTLHEQAGSTHLVKVHGTSDRVRCSRDGCDHGAPAGSLTRASFDLGPFLAEPSLENLPRCPACGGLLRAHVLFFDEYYQAHHDYRFDEVVAAAESAGLVVFAGTSFSVGVTELVLRAAQTREAPIYSIDPDSVSLPARYRVEVVAEPAETVLPWLCERLGAEASADAGVAR